MANTIKIIDRITKVKAHARLLEKVIKNDFDEIDNLALASDILNLALEYEEIIKTLSKNNVL